MKTILSVLGTTCLAAMMVLSGCGDSGDGTCGNTPACGGDIVGAWTITSACLNPGSRTSAACQGTSDIANIKLTGTVTYNADLTYTANTMFSGSETVTLPLSCLPSSNGQATCDQLGQQFRGDPSTQTVTCSGTTTCSCKIVFANETSMTTGTYSTTAAGVETDTPTVGEPSQSDYCVKGKTLTLSPHADAGMMGQSISGTITLTKS
jgi:hypothetical protein